MSDLIAQAVIGDEAKKFMEGELGQKIIAIVEEEIVERQLALETVNHTDQAAILKLQNEIWRARQLPSYLTSLLTKGEEAIKAYKQQQSND